MGVASGTTRPTAARSRSTASSVDGLTPALATQQGIAIVHQHPAVLPDMTVAENIRVAVPAVPRRGRRTSTPPCGAMLDDVGSTAHLEDRVGSLTVAQKHLLELAKALAVKPTLLILDEPTAPLGAGRGRPALRRGCARPPPRAPRSSTSPTGSPRSATSPPG